MSKTIYTLHLFFGLAFILIGYGGLNQLLPSGLYPCLLGLSVIIFAYHSWKLLNKPQGRSLVYLWHILVISLLLAYLGYQKTDTPAEIFYLFIIFGILAIFYHGKKLHRSFKIEVI